MMYMSYSVITNPKKEVFLLFVAKPVRLAVIISVSEDGMFDSE